MSKHRNRARLARDLLVSFSAVLATVALLVGVASVLAVGVASAAPTLSWSSPAPADAARPAGVACPGAGLCLIVDRAGSVLTSADPTAPVPSWSAAPVDYGHELTAVSCADAGLCVAVDAEGYALASTRPDVGLGAWLSTPVDGGGELTGVSCPSESLCVAVDAAGNLLVSNEPARDQWGAAVEVDHGERLTGVSCASVSSCVAVDAGGGVLASANPGGGASAWTRRQLDPAGALSAVSCAASGVCVAVGADGEALASADASAAEPTWSSTDADPAGALVGASCAPRGLCVAVDGEGGALDSEAPTAALPGWSSQPVDGEALVGVSCAADSSCLALDVGGHTLSAPLPAPPAPIPAPPAPRPAIVGVPALGAQLSCAPGVAPGTPAQIQLSYVWLRESEPIAGAEAAVYSVTSDDEGRHLQCRVSAADAAGAASATSAFVTVPFEGLPVATGETLVGLAHARGGRVAIPIACSGRALHGCSLQLRLVRTAGGRTLTLGGRRARLARGARATVTVALGGAARRLLAREHRIAVLLLVSGTVIGSIQAALAEQRLVLSAAAGTVAARAVAACGACDPEGGKLGRAGGALPATIAHPAVAGAARSGVASGGQPRSGVLAATPYMGWDSYLAFGSRFSESTVLEQASDLLTLGLAQRGYRYVWLDAGWWQGARGPAGQIELDRRQWPHGIGWLAATLHHAGLLLGVYTDAGANGCGGVGQGSYGHYRQDAETFAAWGVDAVKVDFCGGEQQQLDPARAYRELRVALNSTPSRRAMLLSICDFLQPGERGAGDPPLARSAFTSYLFGPEVGNSWRTDGDVGVPGHVPFANVLRNLDADAAHPLAAGPGHWNDPDYLGPDQGMGPQQFRTQVSMWAMLAAPLMISRDLGHLSAASLASVRDQEVLAIDQDPLGAQATLVGDDGGAQVWVKPLADGSRAVALLNRNPTAMRIQASAGELGLPSAGRYSVRDLWRRVSSVGAGAVLAQVSAYGTVLLRVAPLAQRSRG